MKAARLITQYKEKELQWDGERNKSDKEQEAIYSPLIFLLKKSKK